MIEIEVDTGTNGDLMFHPAGERVRGRFDVLRVNAPELGDLPRALPRGVPGQVIAFDPATGTGFIREPLHAPENADTRAAIERRFADASATGGAVDFGPAERRFPDAHAGTWVGWMRRAVKAGLARVVGGNLPDGDPADMRKGMYFADKADPKDALIAQLAGLLAAHLPADKKKELAGLLGSQPAK